MQTRNVSDQLAGTYKTLRVALAVLALAFPLVLAIGGYWLGRLPLAGSMSAYYHASDSLHPLGGAPGQGIMRNCFVGVLFAVGALLYSYKGYSWLEDTTLKIAGLLAVGIAVFPMLWPPDTGSSSFSPHGTCAILFFVFIAYVCVFRSGDTLSLLPPNQQGRYRRTYRFLGVAMVACPLGAWALLSFTPARTSTIFWVEFAGIYVFGAYWAIKTYEASKSAMDKQASRGHLQIKAHNLSHAFSLQPLVQTTPPTTPNNSP
jgi:hypothetical protein